MPRSNKTITNLVGGELSPLMYGRADLQDLFQKSLARAENFIIQAQGGAKFRPGTQYVHNTRLYKKAVLIPFQFSDQQAYLVEATNLKFRFYKDNAVITETAKTITGFTQANPGVVTCASHGFSNGDEVYIYGMTGMDEVNQRYGNFFLVAGVTANTFTLTTIGGTAINTSSFTAYSSGGSVARVYEITTPYLEADLPYLQFAQSADTMYIAHQNYEPRKLTRTGHASWTIATYSRTSDPFTPSTATITGVTQANPGVVTTSLAHGLSVGDYIAISAVVGMTELNGNVYKVNTVPTTTTLTLADPTTGTAINTTSYTAYSSAGTITFLNKYPKAVAFSDTGRLMFGGTRFNPETIWASKAPTTGTTAFDNFTTGSGATDALIFTLAPIHGKADSIQWLANTSKFVAVGTFSSIRRIYGATEQEAISPTSVTAKSVNTFGCAYTVPVSNGESLFYVQRGSFVVRSLQYDFNIDGYTTTDRNLVSDHLNYSGIKSLVEQQGKPDVLWVVRNDGKFVGLTYKEKENISGWHRHYLAGRHTNDSSITKEFARVLSIGRMPRSANNDQIWFVAERVVNGSTVRHVEYMNDEPTYPNMRDYYTGDEDADEQTFKDVLYETQKDAIHLDSCISYDGSAYGTAASATVTPSATTGTSITLTASAAVFTSSMVGRQVWKKYDSNGDGGGRALITAYTDSTHVTAQVMSDFDNTNAIAAGSWFLTASTIYGLYHLEGETVNVIADGGVHQDCTVSNGSITLNYAASKVHVGHKYLGMIETLNIDTGGVTGSAVSKNRTISKAALRLLNTLGIEFGSDVYNTDRVIFRSTADSFDRPTPPFSGTKEQLYLDSWNFDGKAAVILQDNPLPCTLLSMDLFVETVDE